ncbi:MAG: VWA domain-containing protein [Planctomycetota bacterium]|nr:VWA domain-containing protein [Planctomycetota bacterium]
MDWRYGEYDAWAEGLKKLLELLSKVFDQLVVALDGDVDQALEVLEQLGARQKWFDERFGIEDFKRWLEQRGTIERAGQGAMTLTKKGEQGLRTTALEPMFAAMRRGAGGDHRVPAAGTGGERQAESRAWEFGDELDRLDPVATLKAATLRAGIDEIQITEDDLRIHETEHQSSMATVLLIDVSHSMVLYGEDRITPAKQVALGLCELITTRFPKDSLDVCLFGDTAWRVSMEEIPYLSAGPYHTNTRDGLRLARDILRKKRQQNRQIVMLTDGKPSALTEPDGEIYKNPFGLDRRVVNKTLEEAEACRRLGIPITTFMLTSDPLLVEFIEDFTRVNHGRAYYSQLDRLGAFVLVDYVRNRRGPIR